MLSLVCSFTAKLGNGAAHAVVGAGLIAAAQGLGAQNMLANPGFEEGGDCNTGFYTEYLCWPPGDAGRGYFTVGTSPAAWNGLFNNCPVDHTPTGSGKMLLMDGDTHRVAWAQTVQNLEANQSYRFSFWAMNLYNANPAVLRVTFRPEPNWQFAQVPPSFHVQIAGCSWQKAEFFWTCNPAWWGGQAGPMTIVVENTTSGEQGADFALDDLEFVPCVAPTITSQPPGFFPGLLGGSASTSVAFHSMAPLPPGFVQWNGVGVAGGMTTLTQTGPSTYTSTLTLSNLSLADVGTYTCTINTACGSMTSSASRLRILFLR